MGDLRAAEQILKLPDSRCPFDAACFHAQQSVEKSLKGFLTCRSIPFPKTHDLGRLLRLGAGARGLVKELSGIEALTGYAVEARTPGPGEIPDRSEAEQAVRLAKRAYQTVQRRFVQLK